MAIPCEYDRFFQFPMYSIAWKKIVEYYQRKELLTLREFRFTMIATVSIKGSKSNVTMSASAATQAKWGQWRCVGWGGQNGRVGWVNDASQ